MPAVAGTLEADVPEWFTSAKTDFMGSLGLASAVGEEELVEDGGEETVEEHVEEMVVGEVSSDLSDFFVPDEAELDEDLNKPILDCMRSDECKIRIQEVADRRRQSKYTDRYEKYKEKLERPLTWDNFVQIPQVYYGS